MSRIRPTRLIEVTVGHDGSAQPHEVDGCLHAGLRNGGTSEHCDCDGNEEWQE
jgi:hypothetical protein